MSYDYVKKAVGQVLRDYVTSFSHRVYGDYPRDDLDDSKFPRASIDIVGGRDEAATDNAQIETLILRVSVFVAEDSRDVLDQLTHESKKVLQNYGDEAQSFMDAGGTEHSGLGDIIDQGSPGPPVPAFGDRDDVWRRDFDVMYSHVII